MTLSPSLPLDVWQVIHDMADGRRFPLHMERQAMQAFETALRAAEQPPAEPDPGTTGE